MAEVTIDVQTLEGAIKRTVDTIRPGPHEHRSDWAHNQQVLRNLQRTISTVRLHPVLGRSIVLTLEELTLIEPHLEAPD